MNRASIIAQLPLVPDPLTVFSPDGQYAAQAGSKNTVIIFSARGEVCTYRGHQEGLYQLINNEVTDIQWERLPGGASVSCSWIIRSTSSTGATHQWNLQAIHLQTVERAKVFREKER